MIIGFDTVDRRLEGTLEAPVSLLMRFCGLSADLRTPFRSGFRCASVGNAFVAERFHTELKSLASKQPKWFSLSWRPNAAEEEGREEEGGGIFNPQVACVFTTVKTKL